MYSFRDYITELKLTLAYHDVLNPKLWYEDKVEEKDRKFLLDNAYKFVEFSKVNKEKISDIVFTGSSANYNYTKFSDVDIHIMVNGVDTSGDTLYDKKVAWGDAHKDLKLAGYPVEYYIQDDHEHFPSGQGVYSLLYNKWLVRPTHLSNVDKIFEDPKTIAKAKYNINYAKSLIANGTKEKITAFKDKLYKLRTAGLKGIGEFSVENIIYKDLRNRGLIEKLNKKIHFTEKGVDK